MHTPDGRRRQTGEWAEGRRYLGLDLLTRCRAATEPIPDNPASEEVPDPLAISA